MCTCSGKRDTRLDSGGSPMYSSFIFGLFDLISPRALYLSWIGYAIILLYFVSLQEVYIEDSGYGMVM